MQQNVYICNSVYQDSGPLDMDYKDNSIDFIGRMCISCIGELLKSDEVMEQDVPIFWGSCLSSVKSQHEFNSVLETSGALSVNPRFFPNAVLNAPPSRVSIYYNIKSPLFNISGGLDSGIKALKLAALYIANGEMEHAIVCYVDETSEFGEHVFPEKNRNFCGALYLSSKKNTTCLNEEVDRLSELQDSEETFRLLTDYYKKKGNGEWI